MTDDAELLRRYAETHSQDAFAELVQRHLNFVYGTALRRVGGNTHRAEEIVQVVVTDLARKAAKLSSHPSITGWLHTSTRLAAAAIVRSEQRRQIREQEALTMSEAISNSPLVPDWEQLRPVIDDALDQLDERDRAAVLLRYFENQPLAQIGQTLALSEDAARKRIDRALEKLRSQLARRGIASTGTALGLALASNIATAAPATLAGSITSAAFTTTVTDSSSLLIVFKTMSTAKMLAITTSAIALLAVGTAVHENRGVHHIQTALVAVTQENTSIRSRAQSQASRISELEAKLRAAEPAMAPRQSDPVEVKSGQSNQPQPTSNANAALPTTLESMMAKPEYQELQGRYYRNNLRLQFGPLYHKLGLNAQQIAEFEAAQSEIYQAMADSFAAARSQGVSFANPDVAKITSTYSNPSNQKLRAILGEEGYRNYESFKNTTNSDARLAANDMASALYYTNTPLTALQAEKLVQIAANNSAKPEIDAAGITHSGEVNWAKVKQDAESFLSPAQLEIIQTIANKRRMELEMAKFYSGTASR